MHGVQLNILKSLGWPFLYHINNHIWVAVRSLPSVKYNRNPKIPKNH